ncbi:MAG: chromosomal replication initiation protein [Candidatus Eremiobacteraeota bacterium]|nr:chromosomal replication initiation protein [Candidatus Eremiobacteraeota bacterium]
MNVIESFHQRLRVESAVFVADADSLGRDTARVAVRRGIDILQARLAQLGEPVVAFAPTREEDAAQRVLAALEGPPRAERREVLPSVGRALGIVDEVVARELGTTVALLHVTKCREPRVVLPRQVAMYLAYMLTGASMTQVARFYGLQDHTTVTYSRDKIEDLVLQGKLRYDAAKLEAACRAALTDAGCYVSKARLVAA